MDANGGKAPGPEPGGVVLGATGWYWLRRYVQCKIAADHWEKDRIEARDKLAEIMGDYEFGHHGGRRVMSVIRVKPKKFNQAAFAEDHPGLWDQYREDQPEQVRIAPVKGVEFPYAEIDESGEFDRGGAS
jgi:hypothetical protein